MSNTDHYKAWYDEAMSASNEAGFAGMSAADVIRYQDEEIRRLTATLKGQDVETATLQTRVQPWLMTCFGPEIAGDRTERNHRFLEEALELVQALGATAGEAHQLVEYVYGRAAGEPSQEVGGVMITLAALCLANDLDMHANAETELARINQPEIVERIREKQKRKPAMSPLPGIYPDRQPAAPEDEIKLKAASHIMFQANALCPHELPYLDKMRWMTRYFVERCPTGIIK